MDLQKEINLNINLKTTEKLDIEAENYTRQLQAARFCNAKGVAHVTRGINYPVEIRNLVSEKRSARRRWQRTRHPADKTILNNKTQKLKREIRKLKNETVELYLTNLTADEETDYSLWKATKRIKKAIMPIPL